MSVAARYRYTANLHLQRKETFLRKANLSKVFYSLPPNFSNPSVGKCDGLIIIISLGESEKMRLAFSKMRLAVGGNAPCILEKARRILEGALTSRQNGHKWCGMTGCEAMSCPKKRKESTAEMNPLRRVRS